MKLSQLKQHIQLEHPELSELEVLIIIKLIFEGLMECSTLRKGE